MFVRVVTPDGSQKTLECLEAEVREDEGTVRVLLKPSGKRLVHVTQDGLSIYLMNSRGQTIDTYRW